MWRHCCLADGMHDGDISLLARRWQVQRAAQRDNQRLDHGRVPNRHGFDHDCEWSSGRDDKCRAHSRSRGAVYAVNPAHRIFWEQSATSGATTNELVFTAHNDGTPAHDVAAVYALMMPMSTKFRSFSAVNQELFIYPDGNPDLRQPCQGCVGINTVAPDYTLDVYGIRCGCTGRSDAGGSGGGYTINGAAPSGHYLRGNGTLYVDSAIQSGDLPLGTTGSTWCFTSGVGTCGDERNGFVRRRLRPSTRRCLQTRP